MDQQRPGLAAQSVPVQRSWIHNRRTGLYSEAHATAEQAVLLLERGVPEAVTAERARTTTVPTALERKGDFSQSVDNNGQAAHRSSTRYAGSPFPDNVIPPNRLYTPGVGAAQPLSTPKYSGHRIQLHVHSSPAVCPAAKTFSASTTTPATRSGSSGTGSATYSRRSCRTVRSCSAPTVPITNDHRYSSRSQPRCRRNMGHQPDHDERNQLGVHQEQDRHLRAGRQASSQDLRHQPSTALSQRRSGRLHSRATFTGSHLANSPCSSPTTRHSRTTTPASISATTSRRSAVRTRIKTGIYLQRSRKDQTSFSDNNGRYNFGDTRSNPFDTGYGYSNALLGVYQTMDQASAYINGMYRYWNIEGFIQDTWKITPRLTLDYGLRLSWYQPQYDSSLQASTFVPERLGSGQGSSPLPAR